MFERPHMLGQVPIAGGPFTGPFGMFSGPSAGYVANPSGTPLMTEELRSPEHYLEEYHCYRAPDGQYVSIPFSEAPRYKAAGYEAVDAANCPGSPAALGQAEPGGPPPVQGNPQGGPMAEPSVPFERQFHRRWWPPYYPQYPIYQPPPPPPAPAKMICKRKEVDGEEIFECEAETPPVPQYTYPVYPTYPVVRIFRPFLF